MSCEQSAGRGAPTVCPHFFFIGGVAILRAATIHDPQASLRAICLGSHDAAVSTEEDIMRNQIPALCLGAIVIGVAFAQAPEAPKPGPEHKALSYFAGRWTSESEMKPGPYGPGGKMTSQDTCEWFAGGFQLVCRSQGKGPMGPTSSMGVLTYSLADKAYTYYGIDSMGSSELSKGTHSGKTWTFTSKSNMRGESFNSRYTIVETSPTSYTFKWDTSPDGTKWSTMMEGKTTKSST